MFKASATSKLDHVSQGFVQLCFKNLQTRDATASLGSLLPALTVTIISLCPTKMSLAASCVYSSLSFHCALLEGSGSMCSVALSSGSITLITRPSQPSLLQVKQAELPVCCMFQPLTILSCSPLDSRCPQAPQTSCRVPDGVSEMPNRREISVLLSYLLSSQMSCSQQGKSITSQP